MRVLQVHNRYRERGGEDSVVETEAALLRGGGHEVVQHLVDNPPGRAGAAVGLVAAPWNPSARRRLRAVVRDAGPDVVHVHNTWYALTPAALAGVSDTGVPAVMTLHNYRFTCSNARLFRDGHPCEDCVGSHPWHGVRHRCYRDSVIASTSAAATIALARRTGSWEANVRRFLVLNRFARDVLVRGGLDAQRITVKPNVVADPGPRPATPSSSDSVLVVGRLERQKGVPVLIEAWRRAAPADLRLDVIGDGELRSELEAQAPPGVAFHGWLDPAEVRARMLRARALAFPTIAYEGQPIVLLEAFAAGLPVLCSDLGGPGEEVGAVAAGLLVRPGDPAAWAAAVRGLSTRGDLDAVSRAVRARYEEHFTPSAGLRRLEKVYAEVQAR